MENRKVAIDGRAAQRTYTRDEAESAAVANGGPLPGFSEDKEFIEASKLGLTFDPDLSGEDAELVQENLYQESDGRTLAPEERLEAPNEIGGIVDLIMVEPQEADQEENHPTGLSEHSIRSGAVGPGDLFEESARPLARSSRGGR